MTCLQCTTPLPLDAVYCHVCGATVRRVQQDPGYAGFWRRALAIAIDVVLLSPVILVIRVMFPRNPEGADAYVMDQMAGMPGQFRDMLPMMMDVANFLQTVYFAVAIYFILLECSPLQGTVGKYLLGLRVTDLNGNPIRFGRSVGRYLARLAAMLPWWFGYFMAGFTRRKQGLHDMISGTLVIRKGATNLPTLP
jgi:uncharacterized RDD family membrane protein YckC